MDNDTTLDAGADTDPIVDPSPRPSTSLLADSLDDTDITQGQEGRSAANLPWLLTLVEVLRTVSMLWVPFFDYANDNSVVSAYLRLTILVPVLFEILRLVVNLDDKNLEELRVVSVIARFYVWLLVTQTCAFEALHWVPGSARWSFSHGTASTAIAIILTLLIATSVIMLLFANFGDIDKATQTILLESAHAPGHWSNVLVILLQILIERLYGMALSRDGTTANTSVFALACSAMTTHLLTLAVQFPHVLHPWVLDFLKSKKFTTWFYRACFGVIAILIGGPMD